MACSTVLRNGVMKYACAYRACLQLILKSICWKLLHCIALDGLLQYALKVLFVCLAQIWFNVLHKFCADHYILFYTQGQELMKSLIGSWWLIVLATHHCYLLWGDGLTLCEPFSRGHGCTQLSCIQSGFVEIFLCYLIICALFCPAFLLLLKRGHQPSSDWCQVMLPNSFSVFFSREKNKMLL